MDPFILATLPISIVSALSPPITLQHLWEPATHVAAELFRELFCRGAATTLEACCRASAGNLLVVLPQQQRDAGGLANLTKVVHKGLSVLPGARLVW
jgi:hypothetical protein